MPSTVVTRIRGWLDRRATRRAAETERAASCAAEPGPGTCPTGGEGVCTDEADLLTPPRDGGELEGSVLEVGGAMAGLSPVERPEADEDKRRREETSPSSECDTCR